MPGKPDPLYALAREVLLDALEALGPHRRSLILVGAQAIYVHTGDADLAVAPFTTDADFVVDPGALAAQPILGDTLRASGFAAGDQPGEWAKDGIRVDLMVPEAVGGGGRRGARLGPHGNQAARKARGLEGALVDNEAHEVASFRPDGRHLDVLVAGPAALLVSKLHKLSERVDEPGRVKDKDALDILRLLRGIPLDELVRGLTRLRGDEIAAAATAIALSAIERLFGQSQAPGAIFAARAAEGLEDADTIKASCAALAQELLAGMGRADDEH
jgi:Nucleotidyltransferase